MAEAVQIPAEARGVCRTCGAAVLWVTSERGRPMPLDADEVLVWGELLFVVDEHGVAHRSQTARGRRSHFATCPDSDRWRRRRD